MKKSIFCVFFLAFASLMVNAQELSRHQISVGHGFSTHADVKEISDENTDYEYYWDNIDQIKENYGLRTSGAFKIGYGYAASKHWTFGLDLSYENQGMRQLSFLYTKHIKEEDNDYRRWDCKKEIGKLKRHIFSILPYAQVYWFKRKVSMYSRTAFGIHCNIENYERHKNDKEINTYKHFACHISPVGIEFGLHGIKAYIETGYGYQGMIQAGLTYIPKQKKRETSDTSTEIH